MTDIVERLRAWHTPGEAITGDVGLYLEAADEIERLRSVLRRLLNDSMYKDHPEASQMAIDALKETP